MIAAPIAAIFRMIANLQSGLSRRVTERLPVRFIFNAVPKGFFWRIILPKNTKTPAGEEDRRAFLITKPDLGGGVSGPLPCAAREEDERCR
jgi:hypothetical protein